VLLDEAIVPLSMREVDHPLLSPEGSLELAEAYQGWAASFVEACRG
jgi:hypothetical protein